LIRRSFAIVGIAGLLTAPVVVGFAQQAGAATGARVVAAAPGHVIAATLPNSDIKVKKGVTKFAPKTLSVKWSGSTSGTCTKKKEAFTISNDTTTSQQVTYEGSAFGDPIPAGDALGVCAWGTGTATASFGLSGSTKTLTIDVS
jgi:hypothetical protein